MEKNKPHPFSPFIIGHTQFPDESGPEYFVQDPDGKIIGYYYTYDLAYEAAMASKEKDAS